MTPRPSDEAREALRTARERAAREPQDDPAPTGRPPAAAQHHRPGDAAREALRRAVRARREARPAPGDADAPPTVTSGDARGETVEPGEPARSGVREPGEPHGSRAVPRGALRGALPEANSAPSGDEPSAEENGQAVEAEDVPTDAAAAGSVTAPPTSTAPPAAPAPTAPDPAGSDPAGSGSEADPAGSGDAASPGRRPGDIAREALRSARGEAERARARTEGRRGPARRAVSPAPRLPRTTRGDRVAAERAREVRAALADAFRMPADDDTPRADPAPGVHTRRAEPPTEPCPGPVPQEPLSDPVPQEPLGAPVPPEPLGGPATPHPRPRSMAAPARDGELRRTFPALPPGSADGEGFAGTWWGRAWVAALEGGALDAARLARGRGYAEQGHVDAITVTPGLVLAYVRGSRPRPYRVQVRLRTFGEADWARFLDAAADRPGHIAALLDKEMPRSLADCGVPLLPGPGDLDPRCSCPDSGHPCKHAAALCYQTARLLDADPFVLLLLRGRGEREVIDGLSRLSAARAARAAQEREPEPLPGVRAAEAVGRPAHRLPPLPAPLPPPPHPEQPPVYPASPGGPDPFALDQLATDAAARAHALLTTGRDPVGGIGLWHDAVRLAAARPGSGLTAATRALYSSLARAADRTPADLARAVAAWRQGGPAGLAVLEEPWDPPAGRFDRARPLLLAADLPAFRPWRNRLTHPRGHVQLRLGRDTLWYAYESEPGRDDWWPRGTPDPDPVGALTGLDAPAGL